MNKARVMRWTGLLASGLVLVVLGLFAWAWHQVENALPPLDGERVLPGLSAPSSLQRDAQGTVIITAANEIDANRLLGFAHAQDRFFQMDLLRRRAAGELSGLFGSVALPADKPVVTHRFRGLAQQVFAAEPAPHRALVEAYTAGVNAGVASLPRKPWEYALLRTEPEPWRVEDSVLVYYALVLDLQDSNGSYEKTITTLRDFMGPTAVEFFNPLIGPADSALDGTRVNLAPAPPPRVVDLRQSPPDPAALSAVVPPEQPTIGSNAFVHLSAQRATLAGDPHLGLRVPNTWYRAQLNWTLPPGPSAQLNGATLPGVPGLIIGSNGHIAWSFTNATVDTGDLVAVDLDPHAPDILYRHDNASYAFETHVDTIAVKGGDPVQVESTWTRFGPLVGVSRFGQPLAYRWTFHDAAALNLNTLDLNHARTVDAALTIATGNGMPPQNFFVADTHGDAAWTVTGRLPQRRGFDGKYPVSWSYGDRGWDGFQPASARPIIHASPQQNLWSGNQRPLGGPPSQRLGDAGFDDPERAAQIERDLAALPPDTEAVAALRAIQLDHRADWAHRWRDLLVTTFERTFPTGPRAEFIERIKAWDGQADARSVGYHLIREWHRHLTSLTLRPIFAEILAANPDFAYHKLRYEAALWTLHRDEPAHLLSPSHLDWDALRLAAVDGVITALAADHIPLAQATWGAANRLDFTHPLAGALPGFIADALTFPAIHQSGDSRMPRVARPRHGASLRMVVSPGDEAAGLYHQPGGASGNPLSPFYRAGHEDWAQAKPSPFLPGEPHHTLLFHP